MSMFADFLADIARAWDLKPIRCVHSRCIGKVHIYARTKKEAQSICCAFPDMFISKKYGLRLVLHNGATIQCSFRGLQSGCGEHVDLVLHPSDATKDEIVSLYFLVM